MHIRPVLLTTLLVLLISGGASVLAQPYRQQAGGSISLTPLGTYRTDVFDESASEIVAHDPVSQQVYVVNAAASKVDVLSITNPVSPTKKFELDLSPYGTVVNSVDANRGFVAVAVEAEEKTDPGKVVFFNRNGRFLADVTVGALPDSLAFSSDGRFLVVANEGEPNDDYSIDPEGSITILSVERNPGRVRQVNVNTLDFKAFNADGARAGELSDQIRIFGPGATVAQDLEPEYVTIAPDSRTAYVTLQENNAVAVVDLLAQRIVSIVPLGAKDHRVPGNGLDASDRDDQIRIANWPVFGLYLPDGIDTFTAGGATYLITANEGDARDYDGFAEEERVKNLVLDTDAFTITDPITGTDPITPTLPITDVAALQADEALGRLNVTTTAGDTDGDGDYDALYAFGGRSFAIWSSSGALIYDSGDDFEQITAGAYPQFFNADNTSNDFDDRSDNKGPEPEGVTVGTVGGRTYAFIGLERIGGVLVYDVTNPQAPLLVKYLNNRDFAGDPEADTAGDLGPEGLLFVPAYESPTRQPLLLVANEVSGSTTIYQITPQTR